MNVGIVTTWHEGGAGYVSQAYRKTLEGQGCNVFIYARGGRYYPVGDKIWDMPSVTWGVRYTPLDGFTRFNEQYVNMLHFENWLSTNRIDAVITNEDHSFDLARRAQKLGYRVGTYIDYYKKDTVQKFADYDFLLCNTRRHYGVFKHFKNALYFPWGTDIDVFTPNEEKNKNIGEKTIIFFHSSNFGGINCRKGTDLLLQAFGRVKGEARLIIHSQAPLSKYGKESATIVREDSRIEFIERTVPAPGLYHQGDVFVYPSRLEGIGLCIPEALSCGLPVITTDNEPMTEFVTNGVNGYLVKVSHSSYRDDDYYWPERIADIGDLTAKMQLYINDREILEKHSVTARKKAILDLDWMKNSGSLVAVLEEHLNQITNREPRKPSLTEKMLWGLESLYVGLLTDIRSIARFFLRRND